MIVNRHIQCKAAVLLVVFSLNTWVGFACSMGIEMGFNSPHHATEITKAQVHIHKDGKKHEHKDGSDKKDDCCNGKVIKLQIADKNLDHSQTLINTPVLFLSGTFYRIPVYDIIKGKTQTYFASQFHPPPRDIRIAIRSFQI